MRGFGGLAGMIAIAASAAGVEPANAFCSVFSRHPCAPAVCSVFHRGACIPVRTPVGQDLRLTVESAAPARLCPE
jgi:hypothetical protein